AGAETEALELARELRSTPASTPEPLEDTAAALVELKRGPAAQELLGLVLAMPRGARTSLAAARRALALSARLHLDAGRLAEARAVYDELAPYLRSATVLRPQVLAVEVARRLAAGELEGLDAQLKVLVHDAKSGDVRSQREAARLETALAQLEGRLPVAPPGEVTGAIEAATRGWQGARAANQPVLEAEALARLADVYALGGRDAERRQTAAALDALASHIGSTRWHHEAEVMQPVGLERLEQLAAAPFVSPVAARRAQALLGSGKPNPHDAAVVKALGVVAPRLVLEAQPAFPGWGIDAGTKSVWLPGRRVEFESRPLLFSVLEQLVKHGGAASKEVLVIAVWAEREYHSGRHDPRLQMTMRKLREAIEDDASAPARILTTADGYALAGPLRVLGDFAQ
ncbi:MAG: winged helix-turn-helix domain-containing protein, partial [Myxococcaceae bacterium]|nr:winged helix-turn-helix domain-containing protein [Myxococcaceae bacterium]